MYRQEREYPSKEETPVSGQPLCVDVRKRSFCSSIGGIHTSLAPTASLRGFEGGRVEKEGRAVAALTVTDKDDDDDEEEEKKKSVKEESETCG